MWEIIKTLSPYVVPSVVTVFMFYLNRRATMKDKKDSIDATYVDSRFDFTTQAEQNLWREIYTLREDLANERKEHSKIMQLYVRLAMECGKPDALKLLLEEQDVRQDNYQRNKLNDVENKMQSHLVKKIKLERGDKDDDKKV